MYLALISALVMLIAVFVAVKKMPGRLGHSLAAVGLFSVWWSFWLYMEMNLENLLFIKEGRSADFIFFYLFGETGFLQNDFIAPGSVLPIKISSALAGFGGLMIPVTSLVFALNFPSVTMGNRSRFTVLLIGFIVACTSWWGLEMRTVSGVIVRTPLPGMWLHISSWLVCGISALVIMFYKAMNFSSPLRGFQALFFPIGFMLALVSGALSGLLFTGVPDNANSLLVSAIAPTLFVVTMLIGMILSRFVFCDRSSFLETMHIIPKMNLIKDQVHEFRIHGIHISMYTSDDGNIFYNVEDSMDAVKVPITMFANKGRQPQVFVAEDYDSNVDSAEYHFIRNNYCLAGGINRTNTKKSLLLIHRIIGHNVVNKTDVKSIFTNMALSPGQN